MATQKPTHVRQRISPREAAEAALRYYREVVSPHASQPTLEEIEYSEGPPRWFVTLGVYPDEFAGFGPRVYKRFEVDAASGEVLAMRMRPI